MTMPFLCPRCGNPLLSLESRAGSAPYCPSCGVEGAPAEEGVGAITRTAPGREAGARGEGAITAARPDRGPGTAAVEKPSADDEPLELGPRWSRVATALAWIRFGVTALMAGLVLHFVAALPGFVDQTLQQLFVLVQNLTLAAAGFSLFLGQLLCLRVPAGTRARPAGVISLAARLLAFGLSLYGGIAWLEAEATDGTGRDADRLTAFALLLGGWAASLLAEFSWLALLRRVGRFLGDGTVVRQARWAAWILLAYVLVSLCLGAVGVAWIYQVVLDRIAAHKAQYPMADVRPLSWLLAHLSGVLSPWKGAPAAVTLTHLIASAVAALFWVVLASRYRAALRAAITTIETGLARRAIG